MSKQIGIHAPGRVGRLVTIGAAAAFVLSWSSGFVIPALLPAEVSWTTLLVWRFAPLAAILVGIVLWRGWHRGVSREAITRQAVIGLFAQTGYCVFVYAAVGAGVTVGTTALIDAVQPLIVATLVGPLLGLRVRGAQWAGLGIGAVGVALVVGSQIADSVAHPLAYAFPVLAMVCLIVGTFLERRSPSGMPVIMVLTVHIVVTAALCAILAAVTGGIVPPTTPGFWLSASLAAVLPTLAAYGLYWWLLGRVGITALNALLFLIAPATAIVGFVLLGEPLTGSTLVGFALCGAGVAAVLVSETRSQRAPRRSVAAPMGEAGASPGSERSRETVD